MGERVRHDHPAVANGHAGGLVGAAPGQRGDGGLETRLAEHIDGACAGRGGDRIEQQDPVVAGVGDEQDAGPRELDSVRLVDVGRHRAGPPAAEDHERRDVDLPFGLWRAGEKSGDEQKGD